MPVYRLSEIKGSPATIESSVLSLPQWTGYVVSLWVEIYGFIQNTILWILFISTTSTHTIHQKLKIIAFMWTFIWSKNLRMRTTITTQTSCNHISTLRTFKDSKMLQNTTILPYTNQIIGAKILFLRTICLTNDNTPYEISLFTSSCQIINWTLFC